MRNIKELSSIELIEVVRELGTALRFKSICLDESCKESLDKQQINNFKKLCQSYIDEVKDLKISELSNISFKSIDSNLIKLLINNLDNQISMTIFSIIDNLIELQTLVTISVICKKDLTHDFEYKSKKLKESLLLAGLIDEALELPSFTSDLEICSVYDKIYYTLIDIFEYEGENENEAPFIGFSDN